jgi:hypothetical protein
MRRLALVLALVGVLLLALLSSSYGAWAAPWMDPERQTVPTRTPTSGPGTPKPATPTEERVVQDTATPVPPTATPTFEPTPTLEPSVAPSQTPALPLEGSPPAATVAPTAALEWDFGDAPDPGFPSLEASDGARHSILSFEWLGDMVDAEPDALVVDGDRHDDATVLDELTACAENSLEVKITVQSRDDPQHPYDAQHLLYLNVLVDWDGSGSWSGRVWCADGPFASEWAVRNLPIDVSSWPEGALSAVVPVQLTAGPRTGEAWARLTLSYGEVVSGEDWDGRGAFTYGETEDYLVTISLPPAATPEVPSPTEAVVASPVSSPTVIMEEGAGLAPRGSLLCLVVLVPLVGAAVLVALFAFRKQGRWPLMLVILLLAVILVFLLLWLCSPGLLGLAGLFGQGASVEPTPTPEPLVPTPTGIVEPTSEASVESSGDVETPTPEVVATATQEPTPEASQPTATSPRAVVSTPLPLLMSTRDRFGFGAAVTPVDEQVASQLHAGWYVNWTSQMDPPRPQGMEYVQMIRVRGAKLSPGGQDLETIARQNPGSLWIVGNEPDVPWQDSVTPTEYATLYREAYTLLKRVDPSCQVAIAGVSQATPLRLQYLDMVLDAYRSTYGESIPVDVWNVHGFVLREERGSWGVDIPPGFSVNEGRLFELEDHDNMGIFREQIVTFRRWMKDRGERDKPLLVSEYGILMPADYGFSPDEVRDFMFATFDFFTTATDPDLGYQADGNRLVQRWAWYSLSDTVYATGNLFDPDTGQITSLGLAYGSYTSSH